MPPFTHNPMASAQARVVQGDFCVDGQSALIEPIRQGTEGIGILTKPIFTKCTHKHTHNWICIGLYHGKTHHPQIIKSRQLVESCANDIYANHPNLEEELLECKENLATYPINVWLETFWPLVIRFPALVDKYVKPYLDKEDITERVAVDAAKAGLLHTVPPRIYRDNNDLAIYTEIMRQRVTGPCVRTNETDVGEHVKNLIITVLGCLLHTDVSWDASTALVESAYRIRCASA